MNHLSFLHKVWLWILVLLLLVTGLGCNIATKAARKLFRSPTPTITLTPTITRTPTITLTPTLRPTVTPLPTQTRRPTPTETAVPTPAPTPQVGELPAFLPALAEPASPACFGHPGAGISCLTNTGWVTYTPSNSTLANGDIKALAVCPAGNLLAAYPEGIQSFNGEAWKPIESGGQTTFTSLACSPDGTFWVGHYRGLSRYNSQGWKTFSTVQMFGLADRADLVRGVALAPDGTVWAFSSTTLAGFKGTQWETLRLPVETTLSALTLDSNGTPWLGSADGLLHYNGSSWEFHAQPAMGLVRALQVDLSGRVWVGAENGLFLFEKKTWTQYNLTQEGLAGKDILSLQFDLGGRLWVGTAWGLVVFEAGSRRVFRLENAPLADNAFQAISVPGGGPPLPGPSPQKNGSLYGRLLKKGNVLKNIRIQLCVEPVGSLYESDTPCEKQFIHPTVRTDGLGDFTFKSLPPGRYLLTYEYPKGNWRLLKDGEGFRQVLIQPGVHTNLSLLETQP